MKTQFVCLAISILLLSASASAQWVQTNGPRRSDGNQDVHITALAVAGAEIFAGTAWGGGRGPTTTCIYHSTDDGDSWEPQLVARATAFAILDKSVFMATSKGIYRTVDHGSTWTEVNEGLPRYALDTTQNVTIECLASSGQRLFAGSESGGVFLSSNDGMNWTAANKGLPRNVHDTTLYAQINCFVASGQNLIAGTEGGVFVSTNNGGSWTASNTGLTHTHVYALEAFGSNLFAGTDGGLFISSNSGAGWAEANIGLTDASVTNLAVSGSSLFALTYWDGLLLSTNAGVSWRSVNSGCYQWLTAIGMNDRYVFVGTGWDEMYGVGGAGVWRRPHSEMLTSVQSSSGALPSVFNLNQNYPNPFNPSTTVTYELPKAANVSLRIYNTLGQLVASPVDEHEVAGSYQVQWNANVPSGIYFYRLQAGEYLETKKMILLK